MNISKIQPNKGQIEGLPANPRIIKDERYQRLKQSIQEDPEMLELRELLVYPLNNEYIIIGGNMRYEALKELGIEEVPVKIIPKETSVEKLKAITIKDNIAYGQWDFDLIGNEWNIEELNEWGFDTDKEWNNEKGESKTLDFEEMYQVIIDCSNETEQKETFDKINSLGYKCKTSTL